jgi:7-cyano-7-deazaguanine synthase in queuosine biosynthesis
MNEYVIRANQVSDQKLEFTWTPNPFSGAPNTFWVEYPFDVAQIRGHDVFYPVLPLFLALGYADTRFHLVSSQQAQSNVSAEQSTFEQILGGWLNIVEKEAVGNFGKAIHVEADVEGRSLHRNIDASPQPKMPYFGTALFLGGGAESLCALAELLDQKIKPHLISYLGPGWIGSDPATNDSKVTQDLQVARELGLELHHVRSSIYGLFAQMQNDLWQRMAVDAFFVNRVPFTPMLVSMFAPLVNVYNLGTVYHGHEKHFEPDVTFHCFTKSFTDQLTRCFSPSFAYQRLLANLSKVEVFEELCTKHRKFLAYQYSCYNNEHERWCHNCEKCFRYYVLFRLYDVPFHSVGFDEARMLKNLSTLRQEIVDHAWSDTYSRSNYREILEKARAREKKDLHEFLSQIIHEGKQAERKKQAMALLRPLVPKPIKQLVKSTFLSSPPGTAQTPRKH